MKDEHTTLPDFMQLLDTAIVYEKMGRLDAAEELLNDATITAQKANSPQDLALCYAQFVLFLERQGRGSEATSMKEVLDLLLPN